MLQVKTFDVITNGGLLIQNAINESIERERIESDHHQQQKDPPLLADTARCLLAREAAALVRAI